MERSIELKAENMGQNEKIAAANKSIAELRNENMGQNKIIAKLNTEIDALSNAATGRIFHLSVAHSLGAIALTMKRFFY